MRMENLTLRMLSYQGCHVRPVQNVILELTRMVVKGRHCYVQLTSSIHVAFQRIQGNFLEPFSNIKCCINGKQEIESMIRVRIRPS